MCDFLEGQPTEESKLDDAGAPRAYLLEGRHRCVNGEHIRMRGNRDVCGMGQRDVRRTTAPFRAAIRASHIHEDFSHDVRSQSEEVGTALPLYVLPVHESRVGFVEQCGRLEHVAAPFAGHRPRSEAVQFVVNGGSESVECFDVALRPGDEQLRDVGFG